MTKFIIGALIAMLAITTSTTANAQSGSSTSDVDRDAMISQLETKLDQLKSERDMLAEDAGEIDSMDDVDDIDDMDELEGSLSAGESQSETGALSNMGSYSDGNTGNSYDGQGYSTGDYSNSIDNGNLLPMESYAAGQIYQSAPMAQDSSIYQGAPMNEATPFIEQAPVFETAPLPLVTAAPVPNNQIIVQQPALSFGPTFLNYVTPAPVVYTPRRCCCLHCNR